MSFQVILSQLASGMLLTISIFVLTLLFSMPLGFFVAFGRMANNKVIRFLTQLYISVMRGTPLMLQLMVVYFFPWYLFLLEVFGAFRQLSWDLPSIMPHILLKSTVPVLKRYQRDNMKRQNCLDIQRHRPFCELFSHRSSRLFYRQ